MPENAPETTMDRVPRWVGFLAVFGLYLTLRGYHAFDGDQAYRLPLLLHRQDATQYATDPFVRAFDAFNPHRGYLAVLDAASRPFGLAAGLAGLFALTCAWTAIGVDRLARAAWPGLGAKVGLAAVVLVLLAKAGNVGTNHLFEATLLDRLVGFALGWAAIAGAVQGSRRGIAHGAGMIGLAALVHPSVGLQLGLTLAGGWALWSIVPGKSGVGWRTAGPAIGAIGLALVPGVFLMAGQGGRLFEGLPADEFRSLAVLVQSPQHMLPSLWRRPQWIAWACYPILAVLALGRVGMGGPREAWPAARVRLAGLMAVNLASLALAYLAVEVMGDLRVTLFQPFRMATLARGLALVALAGRIVPLWARGDWPGRARAAVLAVGLAGDRMLAVATAFELAMTWADQLRTPARSRVPIALAALAGGVWFLARHDTESGHVPILTAAGAVTAWQVAARGRQPKWNRRRAAFAVFAAWAVPTVAALGPPILGDRAGRGVMGALVARCRFAEVPADDLERLAAWCRRHTPESARFVGPPGPKEFRLWSRRAVAFNRAASPYHAAGLGDWAGRYRDHVAFEGPTPDFVRAYLADRHALEARFNALSDAELAALADRQGADHVLLDEGRGGPRRDPAGPLERLHASGRYAVYRVRPVGDHSFPSAAAGATRTVPKPAPRASETTRQAADQG